MRVGKIFSNLILLIAVVSLVACANFRRLGDDLQALDAETVSVQGVVAVEGDEPQPLVVMFIEGPEAKAVALIRVLSGGGEFEMVVERTGGWFFAFADSNRDLRFQRDEAYGWYNDGELFSVSDGENASEINIQISSGSHQPPPAFLIDMSLDDVILFGQVTVGVTASFDDERFSPEAAKQGMWEPHKSVHEGYAGLFLLEPYDTNRIPVLLVHGMNGTPRSFQSIVEMLDQSRYQVWFLNYPSGFGLRIIGGFLYQAMELLQHRYSFDRAHVIAHSMGGLVSREYLNNCAQQNRCDYLQSYTSIASPYAGMASASMGVEYAPSAIPAWIDLSPGSPFLLNLFAEDIPADVRFNLVFAFHNEGIVGAESSDGTVALLSQLRPEAQAQADRLLGIDQTHVGVLDDPAFLNELEGLLVVD
jgi:pimeloyl-ACP methyl ester carboxylesterase